MKTHSIKPLVSKFYGFTLIEAMTVISILIIFLTLGVPSYASFLARKRLEGAAASLYSDLNRARALTLKTNQKIYLSFQSGNNWCYGLSDTNPTCDCSTAGSCQIDSLNAHVQSADYTGLSLTTAMSGLALLGGPQYTLFDPRRGLPKDAVDLSFTNTNSETITVVLRKTGRINLCSNSFDNYPGC